MIENPNPRAFYSEEEMKARENFIPLLKARILENLKFLKEKIEKEEPFPHGNQSVDFLSEVDDSLEHILNNWEY